MRRRRPAVRRPGGRCGRPTAPPKTQSAASPKTKRFDDGPKKKRPDPRHPRPARRAASPPRSNDMATQEIKVPDIGGYDDVPVIEVLRSEEHRSELQSLLSRSYSVFSLKKTKESNDTKRHVNAKE